mmetsp:Transcript_23734/g.59399  ORF Transcript_23734/g.59399 Transcript_23734/m.59399 type:complete len:333 (+) Transcript_23734:41-1039(+)|eukprot:CAMPEP_0177658234 /NCGR_PEP_ID=MMETSP0447-20121125/16685_1 /TAXON_ID=0 /ORGANISM="Stygamoeba regulata, Strain BSH-02190019" /LENGTH=332 /DNA_ID=CAMNT_0019162793 /DNA_START=41 /DNA_END=1039 /DNA_ORIENTATION=+
MKAIRDKILSVLLVLYLWGTITSGIGYQLISYALLRPFSRARHARLLCWLQKHYLSQLVYCVERNHNLTIEWSGDEPPANESALVLPNHMTHDWLPLYSMAYRQGTLGFVKTICKQAIAFVPSFGWTMWLGYWPFITRDWNKDQVYMRNFFKMMKEDDIPLCLWLFPEGTRITPSKKKLSQEHARLKGYPVFENVLLPRPKGLMLALQGLKDVTPYVYDVTLNYSGWGPAGPSITDILVGFDTEKKYALHVHVKRIPIEEVPDDEASLKQWLLESFAAKDKLLEDFKSTGHFPGPIRQSKLEQAQFVFPFALWSGMFVGAVAACATLYSSFC